MHEEYFTVAQVAEKLQVTPQAVYKWIKQKKIAAVYAGADARITSTEIAAFVARSTEARKLRKPGDREAPDLALTLVEAH